MYREELIQAQKRIDELDAQLAEQKKEIEELRVKVARRIPPADPEHGRKLRWLVGLGAAVAALGAVATWSAGRTPAGEVSGADIELQAPERPGPEGMVTVTAANVEIPTIQRVDELAGRCDRSSRSKAALAGGQKIGARLTPLSGVADRGAPQEPTPSMGMRIDFPAPAKVIGVHVVTKLIYRHPSAPDRLIGVVAYDEGGRAIDAVRVSYPVVAAEPDPTDRTYTRSNLIVTSCGDEAIARVEVKATDEHLRLEDITVVR
jgi:hypothetical protein